MARVTGPITEFVKPLGFKKIGRRDWTRDTAEIEQLIWLDRQTLSPKNRMYLCGNIRRLQSTNPRNEMQCRIWLFLADVDEPGPEGERLKRALDQDVQFDSEDERAEIISPSYSPG